MKTSAPAHYASLGSRYFGILLAVMAVIVVLSGIGAVKGVQFGPIITDGGFFLFPFAYILGDVVSEIYGFKVARRAVFTCFALSLFSSLCYWIIIILPGFDDDFGHTRQAALENVLGPIPLLVMGSLIAFLAGQLTNSFIMSRLKARQGERRLWVRLLSSSGAGELIDTLIFCTVAAPVIGITDVGGWANYVIVGFVYKVAVQYLFVPVTAVVIAWIKKREPSYGQSVAESVSV
ncbi:queuosine precursor transporter [Psychromicrobium lacuslunae]|uniref:Probable queuosine precursor transporter n=1 Tax=Psychromicrobium lacuslunae TaxID=1618207 RepID=A0A0D4C0G7_9MICC|nr:queuosine precursor transporter [Psychromicrobium lacuslunae]AJT42167.1 membrane protein [Psychromicrobium lacuslunae]